MDGVVLWESGIEDRAHASIFGKVNPTLKRRGNLLVRKVVYTIEKNGPAGGFK